MLDMIFYYFVYCIWIKNLWHGFQWWYVVTQSCLIWLNMIFYYFFYIIDELFVYDMSSNGDILLSSLNFDLENNLIFCLLLSMSWYNLMINCSIYFFYRNLFYYLILLKLENVILFSLVYTWFFIKQCIARA